MEAAGMLPALQLAKDIGRDLLAPGVFDRVAVSTPGYLLASLRDASRSAGFVPCCCLLS